MMLLAFLGLLLGASDARVRMKNKGKGKVPPPPPPSALRTTTEEDYWGQWEEFRVMSEKKYLTQAHHDERFEIFKDNVDKINRHNGEDHSWELGVNQFADLTSAEFAEQILGGCLLERSKKDKRKVRFVDLGDGSDNPTSIDWVAENKVTPVKNQGQCGSCWAFSTTGAMESRYAIQNGALNSLSEQELVDCAGAEGNNGCRGGLMDYGFEYAKKEHGLCTEASFPYSAKTKVLECNSMRSACGGHVDPVADYVDVTHNSMKDLETAVAAGPVSIAIEADQSAFQLYTKGVFSGRCGTKLDHGVLVVGYSNEGDEHYWKVKNSWGATWGEGGYIRLCKDCDKNGNAGQCGLYGQPSYPTF